MDIDDDDDNGIVSDNSQYKSYAHNIRIICEHNCREQDLDDWEFEYIDRFCYIVEEYFDSFDVRINFYDKEMQLIDGLTFSDANPCDISEYKSYINKKERHILVEYIISFHDINYISLGRFVIVITHLLKILAIFHSHCLKPEYINYSRLQHLYVDNIDIFNQQIINGKHYHKIMDMTAPNWSLSDQKSIWQHIDILRYAYREILGGSSDYTAKDIDRICKLWNNRLENLPRIIKYIYDVCDVKYSFIITHIYFFTTYNVVAIAPRNNAFGAKMDVRYSELYDVLAQGYIPNGSGTQKITVDTTPLQEFNLIYDSFD